MSARLLRMTRAARRLFGQCLIGWCLLAGPAAAQENTTAALTSRHQALRAALEASPLGVPLLVTSLETGDLTRGEVHALIAQPFDKLAAQLKEPRDWCQIVLLHLNIKSCTHEHDAGQVWLTLHSGRKGFETPDKAYPLRFAFDGSGSRSDHLDIQLTAATGPLGTADYRITLGAIPVAQGSFVRFTYAYRSSTVSRLAMNSYLATLGRGKVGFTVIGTGADGKPEHVQGRRGIVERNAVRYYLAIQSHLEGPPAPAAQHFEQALARWFELTERFALQLHELERAEYLSAKRREYEQQSQRQQALDQGPPGRRPETAR